VHCNIIIQYKPTSHSAACKTVYTDACETHCTIPVHTTVFQKMNPRFRNM